MEKNANCDGGESSGFEKPDRPLSEAGLMPGYGLPMVTSERWKLRQNNDFRRRKAHGIDQELRTRGHHL
jgi:hypothetical protein